MPPPPTEVFASRLFLGPALRAQPDRRLVTLVREGYEAAFEEIVRRYGKPLSRYAAAIVGSRSEDVTQDAFSKALLALRRDQAEIELRPWLYRIVRNTALNDLRDRPPTPELLEEAIAAGRGTAAEAEEREQLRELIDGLHALPERQRAAIVMRELEGLGHEEIAAALGVSGGAARQAVFRAREALRGGAGMLLPLPLVRLLLEHGAEASAGATGAAGALAAGGAAGGAGTALKAGAVAAILAGSVGTGIALQHDHGRGERADAATVRSEQPRNGFEAAAPPESGGASGSTERGDHGNEPGDDHREDGDERGGDHGHRGSDDDNDDGPAEGHRGRGRGRSSGPGRDDDRPGVEDRHGDRGGSDDSGHSGRGGGSSREVSEDRSGHGGGGEDHGDSGGGEDSSGHGGGGDGGDVSEPAPAETEPVAEVDDESATEDSSGPGSGSSGSSGRGGGDDLAP